MKIAKGKQINIALIVKTLLQGGLVILPTETVYIAAVDATNPEAVKKLVEYKNRPFGKPFSVGTTNLSMIRKYVHLNKTAQNLYKSFYPGPITIVCRGKHKVAPGIESETGTLGIFVTDHKLTIDVIKTLGKPITTTSANASYQKRPFSVKDLLETLSIRQKSLIGLVVDYGKIPYREASTVIDTTINDPAVLRQGEIKLKETEEILSRSEEATQNLAKDLWFKYEKYIGQRAIIFALEGPMGAGKTIFTKGLARAMGIKEEIVSPTYNLVLSYKLKAKSLKLNHIDAWRMIKPNEEIKRLGIKELVNDKSVLAIEWPEKVADVIRKYNEEAIIVWVKIKYGPTSPKATRGEENERLISWGAI